MATLKTWKDFSAMNFRDHYGSILGSDESSTSALCTPGPDADFACCHSSHKEITS